MTDKKISELTSITGASVNDAEDVLPIVDTSVTTTKKITRAELFKSVSSVDINGGTIDGTVIGATTPAAISGTTGTFSGNVGIGTSSPSTKLHLSGDVTTPYAATSASSRFPATTEPVFSFESNGQNSYIAGVNTGSGYGSHIAFGTGTGVNSYQERVRINSSGNVGIGTSSPATKLHVSGATTTPYAATSASSRFPATTEPAISFESSGQSSYIAGVNTGGGYGSHIAFGTATGANSYQERMRITAAGEVYIAGTTDRGTYNLQVNGTGVWGAGAYVNGSDERLKEDIADLAPASELVSQLRPVTFRYKSDYSKDQSVQAGFIAQELQAVLANEAYVDGVVQAGPQHLNVAYQALIPVLTKALQEALTEIADLKARVAALEA